MDPSAIPWLTSGIAIALLAVAAWNSRAKPVVLPANPRRSAELAIAHLAHVEPLDPKDAATTAFAASIVVADLLQEALSEGRLFATETTLSHNGDIQFTLVIKSLAAGEGPHYTFEVKGK